VGSDEKSVSDSGGTESADSDKDSSDSVENDSDIASPPPLKKEENNVG